jgi:hypothetical protein
MTDAAHTPGLTSPERDFIRHALGLSRQRVGYRNFYAAGDGDGVAIGRSLVAKGFAVEVTTGNHRPDVNFMITLSGFMAAAEPGEEMDADETARMRRLSEREAATETVTA